jgi:hypothetical protein
MINSIGSEGENYRNTGLIDRHIYKFSSVNKRGH